MTRHEIILTVSKVRSRSGKFFFCIKTNLPLGSHVVRLPDNGELPAIEDGSYNPIKNQLEGTLSIIFTFARHHLKATKAVSYKFIFSDKYIATGLVPVEDTRTESYAEITLPMLEDEAIFVFGCIPYTC